jgi:S1-C subfamily serine protease
MKLFTYIALLFFINPAEAVTYNRVLPVLDANKDAHATAILLSEVAALTSAHAVDASLQEFACGNEVVKGKIARLDMKADLAIFALERPCKKVDISKLGSITEAEGNQIAIQGFPGSNVRRTTSGVVADYEVIGGPPVPRLYMVMDLRVSGGNSGGPVLNTKGELVGVVQGKICYNVAQPGDGVVPTCYGLAIPLVTIKAFLEGIAL